jgi:hypothetical protein
MGEYTTVIVHTGFWELASTIRELAAWFDGPRGAGDDSSVGGHRRLLESSSGEFWGGEYKYFPRDDFLAHVVTVPWAQPELVQILIKHEDDARCAIYGYVDGELTMLVDGGGDIDEHEHDVPDGALWGEDRQVSDHPFT